MRLTLRPGATYKLALAFGIAAGAALGLGATTFVYADGASYLGNDARACANCHVMREQYDAWTRSSHRAVAACNDCHAPHDLGSKLLVKATNGFFHSWYFTLGGFHEPIAITPRNRAVTEGACRHCHQEVVAGIDAHASATPLACTGCHRSAGHLH